MDDKYQPKSYAIIRANTKLYEDSENTNSFYIYFKEFLEFEEF